MKGESVTKKRILTALAAAALATVAIGAAQALTASPAYNAIPSVLPPNVASLGFEATSTSQFGDQVVLAGTNRVLSAVTVNMSDWAKHGDYPAMPLVGWTHPITVNVYAVNSSGATPVVGALLATTTVTQTIPWRPDPDPTCAQNGFSPWRAGDGICYSGYAFNLSFDFSALNVTVPDNVIVGVAFNTADYGATPLHAPGPYNSLNVGVATGQVPSVGNDANSDATFWDSTYLGRAPGLTYDTGWAPNGTLNLRVDTTPALTAPPTSTDQCKNDGWKAFNNPAFKNQGDCVSYVTAHPKP